MADHLDRRTLLVAPAVLSLLAAMGAFAQPSSARRKAKTLVADFSPSGNTRVAPALSAAPVADLQYLRPEWFGAVGDGVTDDIAAFAAMRTAAGTMAVNAHAGVRIGPKILLGLKTYRLASSFSWKGCTNVWEGFDTSIEQYSAGSTILMASGATFTVERAGTENGGVGTTISSFSGEGSSFRNIKFSGPGAGVGTAPVVMLRGRAYFFECRFVNGGGHGLQIEANAGAGGALEGNANGWRLYGGFCSANGGSGLAVGLVAPADVNAGLCVGTSFMGNVRYGIEHGGFLGDKFVGIHSDGNSLGHILQTNVNAVCIFDGHYEGAIGGSISTRSWATGIGSDTITGANMRAIDGQMRFRPGVFGVSTDGSTGMTCGEAATGYFSRYYNSEWTNTYYLRSATAFNIAFGLYWSDVTDVYYVTNEDHGIPHTFGVQRLLIGDGPRVFGTSAAIPTANYQSGSLFLNEGYNGLSTAFGWMRDQVGTTTYTALHAVGPSGAAVADAAALTSVDGTDAAAAPTQAEFNSLVAEFNRLRTDLAATRTQLNTALARLRAHKLIET